MNNLVYEEIKDLCPVSIAVKARRDGEYLILANDEFEFQFLNEVATDIYELCDGKHTMENIIEEVFKLYEVSKEELVDDICYLLRDLQWKKLIRFRKYITNSNFAH